MHIKKSIQLTTDSFNDLLQKGNSIDFRLDEPAWADIHKGDYLEFWEDLSGWDKEPKSNARRITVQITDIIKANTFKELFDTIPESFMNKNDKEQTIISFKKWWNPEQESIHSVLGWKITVMRKG